MQQNIYNTYNIHGYLEQYPELKNSYKSIRKGKFNRNIRTGDETDWFWTLEQLELDMEQQFSSVQSLSHVQLFATPWTVACQASLSITNSWSLLKLKSIKLVMPSNHLILCCLLSSCLQSFKSIRVFSNESVLFH